MGALAKDRVKGDPTRPEIILCGEAQANLGVRATSDGDIEYLINDALIRTHGLTKLLATTPARADIIHPVLAAASRFFWHLHRGPSVNQRLDTEAIRFEMYKLALIGPTTFMASDDLVQSGVADIEADSSPYGFMVHNPSERAMYLWSFYFDCSNLSISES